MITEEFVDSLRFAGQRSHDADFELLIVDHGPHRRDVEVLVHIATRLSNDAVPATTTATVNSHEAEPNLICFAAEVVTGELGMWSKIGKVCD